MVRVHSRDAWTPAARSMAVLATGLAAMLLVGALLAVILPPPWLFVPPAVMRAVSVMDLVVALPVAWIAIQTIGVGNALLPLVKCWRTDQELHIAVSAGTDPIFRHRVLLEPGNAAITLSREKFERGATRTTIRIEQHGRTSSLFTPFWIGDGTLHQIVEFAGKNGLLLEVQDGESGDS